MAAAREKFPEIADRKERDVYNFDFGQKRSREPIYKLFFDRDERREASEASEASKTHPDDTR